MDFELYKKVIDDITGFPEKLRVLRIYSTGEPLLNPYFCDMVAYAKKKNISNWIETVTNGSLLNPTLNQKLADSGIDRIRISIEATTKEEYKSICGVDIEYSRLIENISDLYDRTRGKCDIYIKTVNISVDTKEKEQFFYDNFSGICDKIYIENIVPVWADFDELDDKYTYADWGLMGTDIWQEIKVCPFIFYGCVINSDGQVTPCCTDWERNMVYGNVAEQDIKEIWYGEKMRSFWINMLKGKRDIYKSCKKCNYLIYAANDNIDDSAEIILSRLE